MTRMQQTSLYAYYKIVSEGDLSNMQRVVFNVFKDGDMTNKQVSIKAGLEINCVTGRTNELVKYGLIEKKGTVMQNNNKPAIVWGCVR